MEPKAKLTASGACQELAARHLLYLEFCFPYVGPKVIEASG